MQKTTLFLIGRYGVSFLLSLAFLPYSAAGQNVRQAHIKWAKGKPDTVLSGINVCSTPISVVLKRFGKPDATIQPRGFIKYVWHRDGTTLLVNAPVSVDSNVPPAVEVCGPNPVDDIGRTGRGVGLGATLQDIRRVYGRRFPANEYHGKRSVTVLWKGQGAAGLYFRLNSKGRVDDIYTVAGDCNPP